MVLECRFLNIQYTAYPEFFQPQWLNLLFAHICTQGILYKNYMLLINVVGLDKILPASTSTTTTTATAAAGLGFNSTLEKKDCVCVTRWK